MRAEYRKDREGQFVLQDTGWAVLIKDEIVCKSGETRCFTYTTGHVKVTDSKVVSLSDILNTLKGEGFLAA